jgi:hypothetical protein
MFPKAAFHAAFFLFSNPAQRRACGVHKSKRNSEKLASRLGQLAKSLCEVSIAFDGGMRRAPSREAAKECSLRASRG